MADSTYTAKLVGVAGTRTAGVEVTGTYNSNRQAHEFSISTTGKYKLYIDPAGGSNFVEDSNWRRSGLISKVITGDDTADFYENVNASNELETDGLADDAVTSDKIDDGTVSNADLAGSIATSKIADGDKGAVTFASGVISLDNGVVTKNKIGAKAVNPGKIKVDSLTIALLDSGLHNIPKYPYAPGAKLPSPYMLAIRDVRLDSADMDDAYYVKRLAYNDYAATHRLQIAINRTSDDTEVCAYRIEPYTPSDSVEVITLTESLSSSMSGELTLDWTIMPDNYLSKTGLTSAQTLLDARVWGAVNGGGGSGGGTYAADDTTLELTGNTFSLKDSAVTTAKISPSGGTDGQVLKRVAGVVQWATDNQGEGGLGFDQLLAERSIYYTADYDTVDISSYGYSNAPDVTLTMTADWPCFLYTATSSQFVVKLNSFGVGDSCKYVAKLISND